MTLSLAHQSRFLIAQRLNYAAPRSGASMNELLRSITDQYVAKLLYSQGLTLIDVQHCNGSLDKQEKSLKLDQQHALREVWTVV